MSKKPEKEGCIKLLHEAMYEISDVINDGYGVEIKMLPGEPGGSSYLLWRPTAYANPYLPEEIQILEFDPIKTKNKISRVSFMGDEAKALREFINAGKTKQTEQQ